MFFQDIILGSLVISTISFLGLIPYSAWQSSEITTKQLNERCETNYTRKDVFFMGSTITRLCRSEIIAKQLNEQCGTNYTQRDVFIAESDLTELCRIENQKLTIKQK